MILHDSSSLNGNTISHFQTTSMNELEMFTYKMRGAIYRLRDSIAEFEPPQNIALRISSSNEEKEDEWSRIVLVYGRPNILEIIFFIEYEEGVIVGSSITVWNYNPKDSTDFNFVREIYELKGEA